MYTLRYAFSAAPNTTIDAHLINDQGADLTAATVSNSFEINGMYGFTIQHSFQFAGYLAFRDATTRDILALFSVNPQEAENMDIPISSIGSSTLGPGAYEFDYTLLNYLGNPVPDAAIWITSDIEGKNVIAGTLYSDGLGQVRFMLDAGTWYLWRRHRAWNFENPKTITVTAP